jgi:hypothetical protein
MALITMEGFDSSRLPTGWAASGGNGNSIYPAGRLGGLCFRRASNPYRNSQQLVHTLSDPLAGFYFGFAHYLAESDTEAWAYAGGSSYRIVEMREGTIVHLYLDRDSAGRIRVCRGDGTVVGVSSLRNIELWRVWQHFSVDVLIADVGRARVKLNGYTIIDVIGVDTRNGGASGDVTNLRWSSPEGSFAAWHVDDFYLGDHTGASPYNSDVGDCRVQTLRPVATGSLSEWVGSDGDSVDNWSLVDDVAGEADYVKASAVGQRDKYVLADSAGAPNERVHAVKADVFYSKSDSGVAPGDLSVTLTSPGGAVVKETVATVPDFATTFQWRSTAPRTKAPDGENWTTQSLNDLEIGVEVV